MINQIVSTLQKIENDYGVKILFAVESGSRSWGFASNDSDYDVRFVYYYRPESYLGIKKLPETIELIFKDLTPVVDFVGWDLKKFAELFLNSNPTVSEWLSSEIVYINSPYIKIFRDLFTKYFSKNALIHHYISLARKNYESYIRKNELVNLKKYVYILRALGCVEHLVKNDSLPPLNYKKVVPNLPRYIQEFTEEVVFKKQKSESMKGLKNKRVNDLIESYFIRDFGKKENRFNIDEINNLVLEILKSRCKTDN